MMKFKVFIRIGIIISAIIASTFPAVFALWAIPESLVRNQSNGITYSIIFIMAFIGYIGWWRLLILYNKKPLINLGLLATGLVSFVWFYAIEGDFSQNLNWPSNRKEIIEWYIYIYPPLVALFFILRFSIVHMIKQSNSRPAHNKV